MGIQRATVVSDLDPIGAGRLQIATVAGETLWAPHVFPIAAFTAHDVPVGAVVWIGFEDDDPGLPVVLGLADPPSRQGALARDLEAMGDAWDRGHAAGTTDAAGGETPNPYR